MHGLRDGNQATGNNEKYADMFTKSLFDSSILSRTSNLGQLIAESAMVLNLWMYIAHEIYDTLDDCEDSFGMPNHDGGLTRNSGSAYALDEAIAYWIGSDQDGGSSYGHSLYALTQVAGELFGTISFGSEARANSELVELYHSGRAFLAFPDSCTGQAGDIAFNELHIIANKMVSRMMIPLIQMLIHSLREGDTDRIKIYSVAVVPQISACSDMDHAFLKSVLIDGDDYKNDMFYTILHTLQKNFDCLGISCDDVGAYKTSIVPKCSDKPVGFPIGGFVPTNDVREQVKLDLDIKQIDILSRYPHAHSVVDRYYTLGKNSKTKSGTIRSLKDLATDQLRAEAPWFKLFTSYFGDNNYADNHIRDVLEKKKNWKDSSVLQRSVSLVQSLNLFVMVMAGLQHFHGSYKDCLNGRQNNYVMGEALWDEGVAYFTGSREKSGDFLTDNDGVLLFSLAKEMCSKFGTCGEPDNSPIIKEFLRLFSQGKSEVLDSACDDLKETLDDIQALVLVPLIQGNIHYAIINEKLQSGSKDDTLAAGDAFSNAVLPLVDHHSTKDAQLLEQNMGFSLTRKPVQAGALAVIDALDSAISQGLEVECKFFGSREEISLACANEEEKDPPYIIYTLSMVAAIIVFVFIIMKVNRSRLSKKYKLHCN